MTHGSLFSGIGGFDLAAEWMGWENLFHCEWNPFGQRVLKYYWPRAQSYADITDTDFTIWRGRIDIVTGGFPCQPYSQAGKRKGKEDERHLWPEMLRAIREIRPTFVVGENVPGLINWNGGMVFNEVQTDLEAQGYEVLPFVLPAAGVNAPHRRDRIWFIAYSIDNRFEKQREIPVRRETKHPQRIFLQRATPNPNGVGLRGESDRFGKPGQFSETSPEDYWQDFPIESPICTGNDGISTELDRITVPARKGRRALTRDQAKGKHRIESIKGGGNAIAPQVAYQIFQAINQFNESC